MFNDTGRRGGKEERFHEGENGGSGVEEVRARVKTTSLGSLGTVKVGPPNWEILLALNNLAGHLSEADSL